VAGDRQGRVYNVNADQMAVACAAAFGAAQLIFLTDVPGVLKRGAERGAGADGGRGRTAHLRPRGYRRNAGQAGSGHGGIIWPAWEQVRIAPGAAEDVVARLLAGEDIGTRMVAGVLAVP